jgi:hypothetical protein
VAGATLSQLVDTAEAALPLGDTASVRLLVGAELLASDFYVQAINASVTSRSVTKFLKLAYFNEQEHYVQIASILSGEGVTAAVSNDVTFTYPDGTFASQKSIVSFAATLEGIVLGTYLGVLGSLQTTNVLPTIAAITASEAEHASYFTVANGGEAFRLSFPPALTQAEATVAMAPYTA